MFVPPPGSCRFRAVFIWCPFRTLLSPFPELPLREGCFPLNQTLAGFVAETAEENEDQIQDPADAEETGGEEPDDTGADLANIETVDAEVAQKQAQEEGNPFAFMDITPVFIDVGVLIHNIDDRLIGFLLDSLSIYACAAVGAELCAGRKFFTTVFAIHRIPLSVVSYLGTIVKCKNIKISFCQV